MPFSPLTRLFGFMLVILLGIFVFVPDDQLEYWINPVLVVSPLLVALFTWLAVRDAAPLDDLAFHRTLPPGDSYVLRKLFTLFGRVLLSMALVISIYGWKMNFGFAATFGGIISIVFPLWGLLAIGCVAGSLSSNRQQMRIWGYLALFILPIVSASFIVIVRGENFKREWPGSFYFSSLRIVVIVAAILFPLIWWLVAVRRRWILGLSLGALTSAWLPWAYIYGGFFPVEDRKVDGINSAVQIVVKSGISVGEKLIPIEDVISIRGIQRGEYLNLYGFYDENSLNHRSAKFLNFFEFRSEEGLQNTVVSRSFPLALGLENGSIAWGEQAVWEYLRQQIPAHQVFEELDGSRHESGQVVVPRAGTTLKIEDPAAAISGREEESVVPFGPSDLLEPGWTPMSEGVYNLSRVGEIDLEVGGVCRLTGGGSLKIGPLKHGSDNFEDFYSIRMERYAPGAEYADGPWFGAGSVRSYEKVKLGFLWLVALDRTGQVAYKVGTKRLGSGGLKKVMLGWKSVDTIDLGKAETPEAKARMDQLRDGRLYVFWADRVSDSPDHLLIE